MTAFRSIALASLLSMANARNDAAVCSPLLPVTCNEDTALVVESYEMKNGAKVTYLDDTYSAQGGPFGVNVPLSGGTGDLTDGIIPTASYNGGNNIPFVGWRRSDYPANNNAIPLTFKYTKDTIVSKVEISVDDPLPKTSGGVTAPDKVSIGGVEYDFPANTDPQTGPYTATIQLNSPIYVAKGGSLDIELIPVDINSRVCREPSKDKQCGFVFASEFKFFAPCTTTFAECIDQERGRCCKKTYDTCTRRRKLEEEKGAPAGGVRKLFPTADCFLGGDVWSNDPSSLCLEECFAFGERLCFLYEEFGLVQECDDWWRFDGGN